MQIKVLLICGQIVDTCAIHIDLRVITLWHIHLFACFLFATITSQIVYFCGENILVRCGHVEKNTIVKY